MQGRRPLDTAGCPGAWAPAYKAALGSASCPRHRAGPAPTLGRLDVGLWVGTECHLLAAQGAGVTSPGPTDVGALAVE